MEKKLKNQMENEKVLKKIGERRIILGATKNRKLVRTLAVYILYTEECK